jgi:solute carrier family 25 carnitine/acylcarnitine transporter 20/29
MKQKGYMNEYFNEFLAGGIAGSAAWFLILPLDIVKTRQQSDKDKNIGIIESMRKLSREQGLRANFTLGLWPLLVRGFLVNATTFLIYSQTLKLL